MSDDPILISKKKTAKRLGISVGTLDMLRRRGEIEGVRLGKRVLFRIEDVERLAMRPSQKKLLERASGGFLN